jgi:hypothetical protein
MKLLTLHRLASSLSTLYKSMRNRHKTGQNCPTQMTTMFFDFATENTVKTSFLEIVNGIHRFIASVR